jgi:hypothetical protein
MIQPVKVKVKKKISLLRPTMRIAVRICILTLAAAVIILVPIPGLAQADSDSLYRIELEKDQFLIPCPAWCTAIDGASACSDEHVRETNVKLVPTESGFDTKGIWFEFIPDKGVVTGTGENAKWTLSEAPVGKHWLRVKINRGFETIDVASKAVEIRNCDCVCAIKCSAITVESEKNEVAAGQIAVFRAVKQTLSTASDKIEWSVENGQIVSGDGTGIVKVRANGAAGSNLVVKAMLVNDDPKCRPHSETTIQIVAGNDSSQ